MKPSRKKLELPNVASLELSEAAAAIKKLPREAKPSVRMAKSAAAKKTLAVNGNGMVLKATPDAHLPTKKPSVDASAAKNSQAKTMTPKKKSMNHSNSQMRPQEMPPLIKAPRRELSLKPNRPKIPTVFEMFNFRGIGYAKHSHEFDSVPVVLECDAQKRFQSPFDAQALRWKLHTGREQR